MTDSYQVFEDIVEEIYSKLKHESRVHSLSTEFGNLHTDDERYSYVVPLLKDFCVVNRNEVLDCKEDTSSIKLREEGNALFSKKNDVEALDTYTRSIAYAPDNTTAMALAFANRSAVLKSLRYFSDCILDIDRALKLQYPVNLRYKLLFRKGECLKILRQFEAAKSIFTEAKQSLALSNLDQLKISDHKKYLEKELCSLLQDTVISSTPEKVSNSLRTPELSFGPSHEITCTSDALELKYDNIRGRHLVATKEIAPGDVLIVEQPYSSVLLPAYIYSHCSFCLARCPSLLPCKMCTVAMFCSDNCREQAWKAYHYMECSVMPYILRLDMGKMALLAVRILATAGTEHIACALENCTKEPQDSEDQRTLGFDAEHHYCSTEFLPIYYLITNTSSRSVSDLFKRSLMSACLLRCLNLDNSPNATMYGGLLLRLLQSLPCNAHEVSEFNKCAAHLEQPYNTEIGGAAYATLSLLNHSCDPNVVRHSHGNKAVLRAIKTITTGQEIVDNYGYHFALHSKDERQSNLKSQYYFDCGCDACVNDWPMHTTLPFSPPTAQSDDPELVQKESDALQAVISSAANDTNTALETDNYEAFIKHIGFLDKHGARLCQEYNFCQECIKLYFAVQGNNYVPPDESQENA